MLLRNALLLLFFLILSFQQKTHPISYLCCYKNTCRQCSLHQVGTHQSGHLCPRDVFQASLRRLSVGLHSSVFTQATQQNGKPGPPHLIQNHYSDPNDLTSLYSAVGNQEEWDKQVMPDLTPPSLLPQCKSFLTPSFPYLEIQLEKSYNYFSIAAPAVLTCL